MMTTLYAGGIDDALAGYAQVQMLYTMQYKMSFRNREYADRQ